MVVTDIGHSGTSLMIGSLSSNRPLYMLLGSGSGTELATLSGLIAVIGSPKAFTSSNVATAKAITWQADWNSVEMSGLSLREFVLNPGSTDAGESFNYNNLGDAISFDGTNELRIELKWTVY